MSKIILITEIVETKIRKEKELAYYQEELEKLKDKYPQYIKLIKGKGLFIGIEFDFDNIISCGIKGVKMTSLDKELEKKIRMNDIKKSLITHFNKIF